MRIVSLLPSATEILFALGVGESVVGVTFECDFPAQARLKRIVSDTTLTPGLDPAAIDAQVKAKLVAGEDLYTLDEGALRDLDPDLVVTQDLCAVCAVDIAEVDQALEHLGCRAEVLTLDPMTLDEVWQSINAVGIATGSEAEASTLVHSLRQRLALVETAVSNRPRPRMAILEWTDPPFSSGHWVPDLVTAAGGLPVLGHSGERSMQIEWTDVTKALPDCIVVAPCGFRLDGAERLAREIIERGVLPADVPVWAVDADAAFVRPGPRLVDGVEALASIAHPAVMTAPHGMQVLVRA